MTTLSIIDPTIKIIPSQLMISTIKKLTLCDSMPAAIKSIHTDTKNSFQKTTTDDSLLITKTDRQLLKSLVVNVDLTKHVFSDLKDDTSIDCFITISDVKWLYSELNKITPQDSNKVYVHELLENCKIVLPENEIKERNDDLEKRCKLLRIQQQAREYNAMTQNCQNVRARKPEDSIAYHMKEMNRQLIAVFQFVISVLTGFAFGFIGIELMVGTLDFGFKLLLGIMCALIIALAELYFLAKTLSDDGFGETPQKQKASGAKPHQD